MGNAFDTVTASAEATFNASKDFSQALFHSAIEKPVNGVVQVVNHATGTHLPELQLVGAPEHSGLAATAGNMAGVALDFYLLNRFGGKALETAGLSGYGVGANALRAGINGAVFEGLLQPTYGQNFWSDRLKNGGIGLGTFAAFGAAGAGLNNSEIFAPGYCRSLAGNMLFGAATAVPGGIAHSELDALLHHGRCATANEVLNDTGRYAAFGAAFGALNHLEYGVDKGLRQWRDGHGVRLLDPQIKEAVAKGKTLEPDSCIDPDNGRFGYRVYDQGTETQYYSDGRIYHAETGQAHTITQGSDTLKVRDSVRSGIADYHGTEQIHRALLTDNSKLLRADNGQPMPEDIVAQRQGNTNTWKISQTAVDNAVVWHGNIEEAAGARASDGIKELFTFTDAGGQKVTWGPAGTLDSVLKLIKGSSSTAPLDSTPVK